MQNPKVHTKSILGETEASMKKKKILLVHRVQGTRSLLKKDKFKVCWIQLWAKHQTKVPILAARLTKAVI